jgi:hypothetical protein
MADMPVDAAERPGSGPNRFSLPIVTFLVGSAPFCCFPATGLLAGLNDDCGPDFGRDCLDLDHPVFTVWPIVAAVVSLALWVALWIIPMRLKGLRGLVAVLALLPPMLAAASAYRLASGAGLLP